MAKFFTKVEVDELLKSNDPEIVWMTHQYLRHLKIAKKFFRIAVICFGVGIVSFICFLVVHLGNW